MEVFLTAVNTSARQHNMAVGLTMLLLPIHFSDPFQQANGDINQIILRYRDHITGVDLCTLDFLDRFPDPEHQLPEVCETVKGSGLHLSAHAGEFYDARPVEMAIELGAERIGHGIRIIHDKQVMKKVIDHEITLEVCPISNYKTGALKADAKHPLRELLQAGVRVTINTDDQGVQGTTWGDDYTFASETLGLTKEEIKSCLKNSFEASFLPPARKEVHRDLFF
jgi:adenosine deaminase